MWKFYLNFVNGFTETILFFFLICIYTIYQLYKLGSAPNMLIALIIRIVKVLLLIFYCKYALIYFLFRYLTLGGGGGYFKGDESKPIDDIRYYSYTDSHGNSRDQYGATM
jgi:hypothetical protein